MPNVVKAQEEEHDTDRWRARSKGDERQEGAKREPTRPDELVADASERSTDRRPESLDLYRWNSVELCARERCYAEGGGIRVRVEVARLPRQRGTTGLAIAAARKRPQRRFGAKRDAGPEQQLVIPRALNREQAREHRDSGREGQRAER